jgi:hypothetical protein
MRLGLSSCSPVGFDGGPVGFCCEEFVPELVCCAASVAKSASVAIFGAGDSGFPVPPAVSETDVSAATDASAMHASTSAVARRASKATTTDFGDRSCGSSCPCDLALAGETVAVSALAQINASTTSLDFRRCINLRGNLKKLYPGTRAEQWASHQHILVPEMTGEGFRSVPSCNGCLRTRFTLQGRL